MLTLDAVQDSLSKQMMIFPQEKIHVHTDRTMYVPGEKIWFKAYIVDAFTHLTPTYSHYAYFELINSDDSLVQRVMVTSDANGLFHGNIFLAEKVPEGDYTVRAYTRYMENLGEDYFYKKTVRIGSLGAPVSIPARRQTRYDYDVSFFPEGGNLIEGVENRVAFKALNREGASESISGTVVDNEGNPICEVTTVFAGMGSFGITPEMEKAYFLVCKNNNGQEKRFKLPPAQFTCTISTNYWRKRHYVQVKKAPSLTDKPLFLLVHCKGQVLCFTPWHYQSNDTYFSSEMLPAGVIQLLLLDEQMNPVSERLIFNKNEEQASLALLPDKPYYQRRERVTFDVNLTDMEGTPLAGHASVAVTDDRDITFDSLNTITADLLLSSELRGYIESPGYYLQNRIEAEYALDHLMMTHGWRRYEVSDALKGNFRKPESNYETVKEISGFLKSAVLGRPVINGEVLLTSTDGDLGMTESDSAGLFRFIYHFPENTSFIVRALNQKGKSDVELILNKEQFPKLKHAPVSLSLSSSFSDVTDKETQTLDFNKKADLRAQYDDDIRFLHLSEVVVSARKIDRKDEIRLSYPINASSEMTIYREDIESRNPPNVTNLIRSIPGATVLDNGIVVLRNNHLKPLMEQLPLVLIDGMEMPWPDDIFSVVSSPLESISVDQVESIDVFNGPNAAIFGFKGGNGVISITMRRGNPLADLIKFTPNVSSIIPAGYQKPVEFYSPKYETPEAQNLKIPDYRTTIFWKPDMIISTDGKASFDFYASDFPTTYSVVIEGVSNEGNIIRKVASIEVR